jgi:hypothetical protein
VRLVLFDDDGDMRADRSGLFAAAAEEPAVDGLSCVGVLKAADAPLRLDEAGRCEFIVYAYTILAVDEDARRQSVGQR